MKHEGETPRDPGVVEQTTDRSVGNNTQHPAPFDGDVDPQKAPPILTRADLKSFTVFYTGAICRNIEARLGEEFNKPIVASQNIFIWPDDISSELLQTIHGEIQQVFARSGITVLQIDFAQRAIGGGFNDTSGNTTYHATAFVANRTEELSVDHIDRLIDVYADEVSERLTRQKQCALELGGLLLQFLDDAAIIGFDFSPNKGEKIDS